MWACLAVRDTQRWAPKPFHAQAHLAGFALAWVPPIAVAAGPDGLDQGPPPQWFTQKLDHFNPQDNRTFNQQFQTNASNYQDGGPIFVLLGGEGPASPLWWAAWYLSSARARPPGRCLTPALAGSTLTRLS